MRRTAKWSVSLAFMLFAMNVSAQAQQKKRPSCWDAATTQSAMNQCADLELKASQHKLDSILRKLGIDSQNPAQKAWEAYRDAQLEAIYPARNDPTAEYGSVFPMCWAILKSILINNRIRDLNGLTASEGDVCWGLKATSRNQGKPKSAPVKHCVSAGRAGLKLASR